MFVAACLCLFAWRRSRAQWRNYTWLDKVGVFLPIVNWVRKYNVRTMLLVSSSSSCAGNILANS